MFDDFQNRWRFTWRHFFWVAILGFISGLPFSLLGTTLAAWYSANNVDIFSIGLLSLVHQPYAFKFLWSPLLDSHIFKKIGRRRGWILICQVLLCLGIAFFALLTPRSHAYEIAVLAFILALVSATQDIAIDAFRAEILTSKERGLGATIAIASYRIATLFSGALALIMADKYGWPSTFLFLSLLIIICSVLVYFMKSAELNITEIEKPNVKKIIQSLFLKEKILSILVFIFLFKLGEAFTSTSSTIVMPFLIQGLGFSLTVVGTTAKGVGIIATLIGSFLAGFVLLRYPLYRCLLVFSVLQILINCLFVQLALQGKNLTLLATCVFLDNLIAGMGMTALIAFMMACCDKAFSATQFALFSAVSALPRLIAGPLGGILQPLIGWTSLFVFAVLCAIPVLFALHTLQSYVEQRDV